MQHRAVLEELLALAQEIDAGLQRGKYDRLVVDAPKPQGPKQIGKANVDRSAWREPTEK